MGSRRQRSPGKKEIAGLAGDRLDLCIEVGVRRNLSVKYLSPRGPAIRGFVYPIRAAATRIIQIERIRQHAIRSDRSRVEIVGRVKTIPVGNAGESDGVPGRASIQRVRWSVLACRRPYKVGRR